jgi:hypothetical protein
MKTKGMQFFLFLFVSLFLGLTISAQAQDAEVLRKRVLEASHLTRIDDLEMKPWHLKVNFQLFNRNGKPSEQGTYEYWWGGPMLLKARTGSPSYTATVINNRDGNFRTAGSGPFPKQIAAIAEYLIYPMPMAEDLSGSIPHIGYEKLENLSLDCIELREPRSVVQPPTFCLEPATNVLRAIRWSGSKTLIRNKVGNFQGRSVGLLLTAKAGKSITATAEVTDLSETTISEGLFTPSQDMEKVDAHTVKITRIR